MKDFNEEDRYTKLFKELCKMKGYPCKECPKKGRCGSACMEWFDWFVWSWRTIQRNFGITVDVEKFPPNSRKK